MLDMLELEDHESAEFFEDATGFEQPLPPQDPLVNPPIENGQIGVSSEGALLSTDNGEPKESSEDVIKKAISDLRNGPDKEKMLSILLGVKALNLDADTVVKVVHDLVADKELDLQEALVLKFIHLSSSLRTVVLDQIDQAIKSGAFNDVECKINERQELENCVVVAEKMVLAEYGIYISEGGLTVRALLDGSLKSPFSGVNPLRVGEILTRFEIDNDRVPYATIEQLERFSTEGRVSILGVDAKEIWKNRQGNYVDDDGGDRGRDENHAVVFRSVDRSDPSKPMVIVRDPAQGVELAIPLDQFMDAWADSGNFAVVTRKPAPPLQCEVPLSALDETKQNVMLRDG